MQREQDVVGEAEAIQDDVPAVGAHDDGREKRRERQRDQQALVAAPRAHEEVGERISEENVERRHR